MKAGLILSRLDSSRFPNKALKQLGDKKLVEWAIEGVKNTKHFTPILVTTNRDIDDPLIEIAKKNNIFFFRGDLNNVGKRVKDCLSHFNIDIFARVNGDSPFILKELFDEAEKIFENNNNIDFVTNLLPRHYPYGISLEMMRSDFFNKCYINFRTNSQKEHITSWMYENQQKLKIHKLVKQNINKHNLSFVVDTIKDYNRVKNIINNNHDFDFFNSTIEELIEIY